MEVEELFSQNLWWRGKEKIEEDITVLVRKASILGRKVVRAED
jgi:hypothetical protein